MTREELYQALNFIGDNWTGDDAHACHEAIERIATLEAHNKLLREECRAARIWEDSHFDDDEPTMNPPVTIPHHIACKNKEAARAATDAAGALGEK